MFFKNFTIIINANPALDGGRAFGTYFQANSFALAIIITGVILPIFFNKRVFILILSVILVILSGSRANIIILIVLMMWQGLVIIDLKMLVYYLKKFIFFILFIFFFIYMLFLAGFNPLSFMNKKRFVDLKTRVDFIYNFTFDERMIREDASMQDRVSYQELFWKRIKEKPITGYGIGSKYELRKNKKLKGSSHNEYLKYLFQGGIIYLGFLIGFLAYLLYIVVKIKGLNGKYFLFISSFLIFIILESFFTNTLFETKLFYIVLGIIGSYYDEYILRGS